VGGIERCSRIANAIRKRERGRDGLGIKCAKRGRMTIIVMRKGVSKREALAADMRAR
jgi:hypothetical protein